MGTLIAEAREGACAKANVGVRVGEDWNGHGHGHGHGHESWNAHRHWIAVSAVTAAAAGRTSGV